MIKNQNIKNLVIFVLAIISLSNESYAKTQESRLSESDKKQIVVSILNRTNFKDVADSDCIQFSTENLPQAIIENFPKIEGFKVKLLPLEEIEEKSKYGLTYWYFSSFEKNKKFVLFSIIKTYTVGNSGFSSSSGLRYEYKKVKGRWKGKIKTYIIGLT